LKIKNWRGLGKYIFAILGFSLWVGGLLAQEPISPLPLKPTYNPALAALGQRLFFDPILSKDKTVSCASCHDPAKGGADGRERSEGVGKVLGGMNAPSVFNAGFNFSQFWNGRAASLEEQALGPIQNPVEMNLALSEMIRRLEGEPSYQEAFVQTFNPGPLTPQKVALALAEFERALVTSNSRFDRYLRKEIALSEKEQKGYRLFKGLGCVSCHNGRLVGGNSYQKIGVVNPYPWFQGQADLYALTQKESDKNRFKVPSLRMSADTAPYFSSGEIGTLEAAIAAMGYYNLGVTLDQDQIENLVAFIKSLKGETPAILEAQ